MLKEFTQLKAELSKMRIDRSIYSINTLPQYEGFCIFDTSSAIEVFYFERGHRFDVQSFYDVEQAIKHFKRLVISASKNF